MYLEKAESAIKQAWIAGVVSAVFSVFGAVLFMAGTGGSVLGFVDVAIMLVLTFGVYKKSRIAAVLLFLFFVGSKLILLANGAGATVVFSVIFVVFFVQGIRGTFAYHREMKAYGLK